MNDLKNKDTSSKKDPFNGLRPDVQVLENMKIQGNKTIKKVLISQ